MRQSHQRNLQTAIILLLSLASVGFGYCVGNAPPTVAGAVGVCYALLMAAQTGNSRRWKTPSNESVSDAAPAEVQPAVDSASLDDPVEQMLAQSRYALLLRRQVVENLSEEPFQRSIEALRQGMAFVPEGDVEVFTGEEPAPDHFGEDAANQSQPGRPFHLQPFFLDRWPVTNRQYHEFVAAGGYRDVGLWKAKILTAVLDMVDQTGQPGPRFWRDGRYPSGEEDLPVVGISWYEAAAYARWACKRLPTDAEWVKAASWPVPIDGNALAHRRYPWGDAMDHARANVWGSGPNRLVSVKEFAEGASVGGIYQLIGNVWEWTEGEFDTGSSDGKLELPTPMKSIRGGAFDTYFDSQASTRFQSGESPLSRRHNIGFRCAVAVCDVVLNRPRFESSATGSDGAGA